MRARSRGHITELAHDARHTRTLEKLMTRTFLVFIVILVLPLARRSQRSGLPSKQAIIRRLRNSEEPFVVIPQYWSKQKVHEARVEAKRAIAECHQRVNLDYRRLGVNEATGFPYSRKFAEDPYLGSIAHSFLGIKEVTCKAQYGITLKRGNSGDGWHQDSKARGIKALMYLDDVDDQSGPFEMLVGYNVTALRPKNDPRGRNTRFSDEHISQHMAANAKVQTILGSAGTLILFDTSHVHRGKTVHERGRIVLTNYYATRLETAACVEGNMYADLSDANTLMESHGIERDRKIGLALVGIDLSSDV